MNAVLFVSNGHGEAAIAKRIAAELRALAPLRTDHFPLVGSGFGDAAFHAVGPARTMPSGGLVANGNVRAFARDVGAGFFALLARQLAFVRRVRGRYAAVVAVGDVYALLMARITGAPALFVGTAKSVYVAPYGPGERRILRGARTVFVRDERTADALRRRGVDAHAPGNVIVDLLATEARVDWRGAAPRIAILPGSREPAYDDAVVLARAVRELARRRPGLGAIMSIAPGLDAARFGPALAGEPAIAAWDGDLGALLAEATIAFGQAGTANEAAAALGVPVVALRQPGARAGDWYRMRQGRLLGDALALVPGEPAGAAAALDALLADPARLARMAATGRERMGAAGGARTIAQAIADAAR